MSGYLLDTDWCIDLINNQPAAHQAMPTMTREGVAISLVTYGELYEGAFIPREKLVGSAARVGAFPRRN
jgi:predicted nucleic acid-binding protein